MKNQTATAPWNDNQVVYVTQHEQHVSDNEHEHEQDAELVRAVIRAIQRSPRLRASLVIALESKV